jgi:mevalonate kinase
MIDLPKDILSGAVLVDSGRPNETTKELVAWMKMRGAEIESAINVIGDCTERLLKGEDLRTIMRDHHRAQIALGVVPESAVRIIEDVESKGGTAKVVGAGARTGGGGMVLCLPPQA